ncbi:NrtR DNA-binding winged helix domain-containing protein [Streptomyces hygroscopicus]|uniref:NrtR DNA-binding winged helix domain-containing protein n=1 Tax=Streptomyces hygroscopicus TaxID=1912 RepID=UPI003557A67F
MSSVTCRIRTGPSQPPEPSPPTTAPATSNWAPRTCTVACPVWRWRGHPLLLPRRRGHTPATRPSAQATHAPVPKLLRGNTETSTVWGTELDTRNFYRKVQAAKGFIIPAGPVRRTTGGRPARLYRAGPKAVLFPPLIRPVPSTTEEDTREAGQ